MSIERGPKWSTWRRPICCGAKSTARNRGQQEPKNGPHWVQHRGNIPLQIFTFLVLSTLFQMTLPMMSMFPGFIQPWKSTSRIVAIFWSEDGKGGGRRRSCWLFVPCRCPFVGTPQRSSEDVRGKSSARVQNQAPQPETWRGETWYSVDGGRKTVTAHHIQLQNQNPLLSITNPRIESRCYHSPSQSPRKLGK